MKSLLIYLPAFNEEESISKVIQSIPKTFQGVDKVDVIVVNDGSRDSTENEVIKNNVAVLNHMENKGVGEAFKTAIRYAIENKFDLLLSFDSDGQFNPNDIQKMIHPIINGKADFCIGNRFHSGRPKNMSKVKFLGNKLVNRIIGSISKRNINDASCGFRAYSSESLLQLNLQGSFTYTHESILNLLFKGQIVEQIPISIKYFENRESRVANNIFSYGVKTSKIILKSLIDYAPFYFFISISILVLMSALILGGFVGVHWLITGMISPYKGIGIISISLVGIAIMIGVLAFVGDMLGRVRKNQEEILYLMKKNNFEK